MRSKQIATENRIKRISNKRGWSKEEKEEEIKEVNETYEEFKQLKQEQLNSAERDIEYYTEAMNQPLQVFEKRCEACNLTFKGKTALQDFEEHTKTRKHRLKVGEIEEYWECKWCKEKIRKTNDYMCNDINVERHEGLCTEKDKPRLDENGNIIIEHLENQDLSAFEFTLNFNETFDLFNRLNVKHAAEYFLTDTRLHNKLPPNHLFNHPKFGIYPTNDTKFFISEGWDLMVDMVGNPIAEIQHRNEGTLLTFVDLENDDDKLPIGAVSGIDFSAWSIY